MINERGTRAVNITLGSFRVHIPVTERIDPEFIFLSRDLVNEVFQSATHEMMERRTLLDQPIRPYTLVSNVRHGSIEFDILYRILADIPWAQVAENSEWCIKHGIEIIEKIGSVAAGIYVFKDIGKWIRDRLRNKQVPMQPTEKPEVTVELTSKIEIDLHVLDSADRAASIQPKLYADKKPISIATVVTNKENLGRLFRLHPLKNIERNSHIGGQIILNDLNLHTNGIQNIDQLNLGDILLLSNHSALGIQLNTDPNSVYNSAASTHPDIEIRSMKLSTYDSEVEHRIYRGRPMDSDELPNER